MTDGLRNMRLVQVSLAYLIFPSFYVSDGLNSRKADCLLVEQSTGKEEQNLIMLILEETADQIAEGRVCVCRFQNT